MIIYRNDDLGGLVQWGYFVLFFSCKSDTSLLHHSEYETIGVSEDGEQSQLMAVCHGETADKPLDIEALKQTL